jgi:protease-4
MAKRKHPILTVIIILAIAVIVLGGVMTLIFSFFGNNSKISFGEKIGVVLIQGTITDAGTILMELDRFRRNRGVKAIILRIDSPGGGVGPSQEIYREVLRTRKEKKVIASLGSVAASGGYYVAASADKIMANGGTITGSIGVLMEFVRLQDLLKKIGVTLEVLKSGEFKDMGSPHRDMTERERILIQHLLSDIQNQFVRAVADGRGLSVERVQEIADGRIFSGAEAMKLGLVDELGNFQDAVNLAKDLSGITGEPILVYPKRSRPGLWDLFFRSASESFIKMMERRLNTNVLYEWDGYFQ